MPVLSNESDELKSFSSSPVFGGENVFLQVFMRSAAITLILDPADGRILEINEAAIHFYGASSEEMRAKHLGDLSKGVTREVLMERLERVSHGESTFFQTRHTRADGQVRDVITCNSPVRVNDRLLVICVVQDISGQKHAEQEMLVAQSSARESAGRFQRFFDENSAVKLLINPVDLRILDANDAAAHYYGWSQDVLKGKYLTDFSLQSREELLESCRLALEKGAGYGRGQHKLANDQTRDVELYTTVIFEGSRKLLVQIVHDITDGLRAEKSLRNTRISLAESEERFRQIFERSSAAELFVSAIDGQIMDVNDAACHFYGWNRSEMLHMNLAGLVADNASQLTDLMPDLIAGKQAKVDIRRRLKSGQTRDVEAYLSPISIRKSNYVFIIILDISERKKAEASLNLSRRALEATTDGVIISDARLPGNPIIYANHGYEKITGYSREECIGRNSWFLHNGDVDQPDIARMQEIVRAGNPVTAEVRNYRKDGSVFWNEVHISPVRDMQGTLTHFVGIQQDITQRKQTEVRINYLALFDSLTDLPNRQLFLDRLSNALALSRRSGQYGAIAFMDLDNFKNINDADGHEAGDQLLKEIARRLKTCLRQQDTPARLGGDEFVVLLPGLGTNLRAAATEARNVMARVRLAVAEPIVIGGTHNSITASIGVVIFPQGQQTADDLLQQADTAMYKAKASGRNALAYFEPAMQATVQERLRIERELRQAVEHGEFEMFLQPQVDDAGLLVGAEALMRWRNAKGELILPGDFIPVAEETGLIVPMGTWMIEQACEAIASLQRVGKAIRIAVNVSPRQFRMPDFKDSVAQILARTGIDPALLTLEVTEAIIFDSLVDAVMAMQGIRELGVTFSIDDFGTGYSSLTSLKKMPVSELKIDRAFIQDAPGNSNDAALVEAILAVARLHNLQVVAEGVETQEHVDFLKQRGCAIFQGYFFGRPIPSKEFLAKLLPAASVVV